MQMNSTTNAIGGRNRIKFAYEGLQFISLFGSYCPGTAMVPYRSTWQSVIKVIWMTRDIPTCCRVWQ